MDVNAEIRARQFRKAVMFFCQTVEDDSNLMEIASVLPSFEDFPKGHKFELNNKLVWGTDSFGDPQIWKCFNAWTKDGVYTPDNLVSFFKKVGETADGTPIWTQPILYDEAYDIGDIVMHKDKKWVCRQGNASGAQGARNTFEPGVWGWEVVT